MDIVEADELLVEKLVLGDQLAAPILISVHGDELLGLLRCIAPRLSDADRERVLEMALVEGIKTFGSFESGSGAVFDWFAAQIRLQTTGWIRTHPVPTTDESVVGSLPPIEPFDELTVADLAAVVRTLHSGDCLMLALRNWHGLAYSTIGRLLGIKELTARQKTKRALDRLEVALSEKGLLPAENSQAANFSDRKPRSRQMNSSPLKSALWVRGFEIFDGPTVQNVADLLGQEEQISPRVRQRLIVAARRALEARSRREAGPSVGGTIPADGNRARGS